MSRPADYCDCESRPENSNNLKYECSICRNEHFVYCFNLDEEEEEDVWYILDSLVCVDCEATKYREAHPLDSDSETEPDSSDECTIECTACNQGHSPDCHNLNGYNKNEILVLSDKLVCPNCQAIGQIEVHTFD